MKAYKAAIEGQPESVQRAELEKLVRAALKTAIRIVMCEIYSGSLRDEYDVPMELADSLGSQIYPIFESLSYEELSEFTDELNYNPNFDYHPRYAEDRMIKVQLHLLRQAPELFDRIQVAIRLAQEAT